MEGSSSLIGVPTALIGMQVAFAVSSRSLWSIVHSRNVEGLARVYRASVSVRDVPKLRIRLRWRAEGHAVPFLGSDSVCPPGPYAESVIDLKVDAEISDCRPGIPGQTDPPYEHVCINTNRLRLTIFQQNAKKAHPGGGDELSAFG